MDASVYVKDGVLVVDFNKIYKCSHCRLVEYSINDNMIIVTGNKVKWDYEDKPEMSVYAANRVDPNLVLPEYLETYSYLLRRTFWQSWFNEIPRIEVRTRVKPGWVELKETNIPFHIKTNMFRIYYKIS
jgi:hypothetical protein